MAGLTVAVDESAAHLCSAAVTLQGALTVLGAAQMQQLIDR